MIGTPDTPTVFVEAPARLHFGVLDLRGSLGRWFGGIGAAAPSPSVLVSASRAEVLDVVGPERHRAERFARRFLDHYGVAGGARVSIDRTIPSHAGLGAGTQLALAVGRALAELYDIVPGPGELASAVGRAKRSAIGTWTFAGGGLVVEGGRPRGGTGVAPLIARIPFPPEWWCVIGVPGGATGLSGESESRAFRTLPEPNEPEVARVSHLVLMSLLPALADGDLDAFGGTLSEIQEITGRWFGPAQGGAFAAGPSAGLVRAMKAWRVRGVGQSSWGPAVYGIASSEAAGRDLAARVRDHLGEGGSVHHGPFRSEGARVWRESASRTGGLRIRA